MVSIANIESALMTSGACFLAIITVALALHFSGPSCGPFDEGRARLVGTQWDIVTLVQACTSFDAYEKIVAESTTTHERQNLVEFPDVPQDVRVAVKNGTIVITVPNLVAISSHTDEFEGHTIMFNYVPKDDPEARADFILWLHHLDDPRAAKWHEDMMKAATVSR